MELPETVLVRPFRMLLTILFALAAIIWLVATAQAGEPRNPYSSFNLSGINWGSMQWEADQRAGRVVWPYYNVPGRGSGGVRRTYVGGGAGGGVVVEGGSYRPTQRSFTSRPTRRWRR
ncbi:MAG: hypothetical protein EBZ74_06000 [Planctomycetia bacterium]|nr:hypothetical protein [Planctomycetia bacterium]